MALRKNLTTVIISHCYLSTFVTCDFGASQSNETLGEREVREMKNRETTKSRCSHVSSIALFNVATEINITREKVFFFLFCYIIQ